MKEAQPSVLAPYVGATPLGHEGRRVVAGQRLTQAASDIFLGWATGPSSGHHYYVRQLWDVKGQGDLTRMDLGKLTHYGALCARALARAHARTGDAAALAGYLGARQLVRRRDRRILRQVRGEQRAGPRRAGRRHRLRSHRRQKSDVEVAAGGSSPM